MSLKISIPASVLAFAGPDVPVQQRLLGAGGNANLGPREQLLLLFCLSKDTDTAVRSLAVSTIQDLVDEAFNCLSEWPDLHPAILHTFALIVGKRPNIRTLLLKHPALADVTSSLLKKLSEQEAAAESGVDTSDLVTFDEELQDDEQFPPLPESEQEELPDFEADQTSEEYQSKYKQAQTMSIADKIKMALTGDKEWRKILIKDANKLVSSGVIKNPRITEPEVLNVLKSGVQNDEIIRLICANREWVKNYQIRKALVENPKTPLTNALRYLGTVTEKDLAGYAKSRNISSVISTQAKRMLLSKKH